MVRFLKCTVVGDRGPCGEEPGGGRLLKVMLDGETGGLCTGGDVADIPMFPWYDISGCSCCWDGRCEWWNWWSACGYP